MDYADFLYYKYRDNVIMVTKFRERIHKDYGLSKDDTTRLVNRIFDYQRKKYGDLLDSNNYEYTMEELRRISINANSRKHHNRRYRERR